MRYLVKARLKPGQKKPLLEAVADGSLGRGSIAGDEYVYDLQRARVGDDGVAHWVETCFCATPLAEERPYWEKYFDLLSVKGCAQPQELPARKWRRTVGLLQL